MFVDGPSEHVRNEKNWIGTLCLNEWADHRPSRQELIAEIVCFPGDIWKLTTHFLILRNTRTLLNLEYHQKQLWRHIKGQFDMVGFFFCAVIYFTRVLWIRMWGQPSELAPIMMGCDTEIRKKASSKVYDVWIAGLLKMNWKHCTEINIMFLYSDCKLVAPWMSQCWMCQIWRPCSNAFPFSHFLEKWIVYKVHPKQKSGYAF